MRLGCKLYASNLHSIGKFTHRRLREIFYRATMSSFLLIAASIWVLTVLLHKFFIEPLLLSPLSRIPGPKSFALTKWRLALEDLQGTRSRTIWKLHQMYGPVVRIGPSEVSFNSVTALKTIYGAGSGYDKSEFYDMFDVYGTKNLFTFYSSKDHAARKRLLAHAYSKSVVFKNENEVLVQRKVDDYLNHIRRLKEGRDEIFSSLHYFAIDAITDFLYGDQGKTGCMRGVAKDQALLHDIMDVSRRRLAWFAVHFPTFTKWLYSRTGVMESIACIFYPMQKPTTYTGIRDHALITWQSFKNSRSRNLSADFGGPSKSRLSIMELLWASHISMAGGLLDDLDIASECADHLLAGIDTTSDTLMALVWALSRPQNKKHQTILQKEVDTLTPSNVSSFGMPSLVDCDKLPFLDAVIKETLRLYTPIAAGQPRRSPTVTYIDGFMIPPHTVVSMSAFSLHRNSTVFEDPLTFDPGRWLNPNAASEMNKWFWAFSSGARMCIGLQ
jgi:hypothetical protein